MAELFINKYSKKKQYALCILAVCLVSSVSYLFSGLIDYRIVSFVLLVTVSLLAMLFDILPVFLASLLSALIWDYFFIPPHFTFQVSSIEDGILLIMYFIIAMINAVLTYKIRRAEDISRQKEGKAQTIKLYNTVLNSLSHELRTPIATIIGATDNLQHSNKKLSDKNKQELIGEISKASFRLNQQVENLLNMSRLESGFIQPRNDWCDVNEVVYNVVKRMEENNIVQKLNITVDPALPLCKADKGILEQVIYNLVNNASQYTPDAATISITVSCASSNLTIIIEDDGAGIPVDEMEQIFEKFYRVNNSKTGGTGLGLSIVKGFIEACNGTIHLENVATGGARFIVSIPVETSSLNPKND